ncbi:MAG: hypothetical protein WD273_11130 [Trueperaceae bacterium]
MRGGPRRCGIALVAALLTLASLATLALGTTLLVRLDLKLVENRQELALARAQAHSLLTLALLELETHATTGELPEEPPSLRGLLHYSRETPSTATVSVQGAAGSGRYRTGARIELVEVEGGWRIHIVERR